MYVLSLGGLSSKQRGHPGLRTHLDVSEIFANDPHDTCVQPRGDLTEKEDKRFRSRTAAAMKAQQAQSTGPNLVFQPWPIKTR